MIIGGENFCHDRCLALHVEHVYSSIVFHLLLNRHFLLWEVGVNQIACPLWAAAVAASDTHGALQGWLYLTGGSFLVRSLASQYKRIEYPRSHRLRFYGLWLEAFGAFRYSRQLRTFKEGSVRATHST